MPSYTYLTPLHPLGRCVPPLTAAGPPSGSRYPDADAGAAPRAAQHQQTLREFIIIILIIILILIIIIIIILIIIIIIIITKVNFFTHL